MNRARAARTLLNAAAVVGVIACYSANGRAEQSEPASTDEASGGAPEQTAAPLQPTPGTAETPSEPPLPQKTPLPPEEVQGSMTFPKTKTSAPEVTSPRTRGGHGLTMQEVSEQALQELHLGSSRVRYSLNFFGETSISVGDPAGADQRLSFNIGPQDFLLRGELGEHLVATTEFDIEIGSQTTEVDLERLHVRWQTEHFFIEAGRTHTALGYWNNAYHHGSWLQPTIERPRWVAFEDDGGVLPVHWVGLDVGAKFRAGAGTFDFTASVGNNRGKVVDDVRNTGDYSSRKAVHAALEYTGLFLPDLHIGVSGIAGRIPAQPVDVRKALSDTPIDEWIGGAHIAYPSVPLMFIAEAYLVDHSAHSQHWKTYGGFALLGYSIAVVSPYVEYERFFSKGGADPFFVPDPAIQTTSLETSEVIVGTRIDLTDWSALKAEYRNTRLLDRSLTVQQGVVDWAWGF